MFRYVDTVTRRSGGKIIVVMPAHNEAHLIGVALESLQAQTLLPDEVVVVADRCLDATAATARALGATVIETVDNRFAKAGALNAVLDDLLPRLTGDDAVLMMDADSSIPPEFLAEASERLDEPFRGDVAVGGVGGIFLGTRPIVGFLGHLQNNEYVRYAREIGRLEGRAAVLTGTATLFSVIALREVKTARANGELPAGEGVYDVGALTEDNELTLALKQLGYSCVSPKACTVRTQLPDTAARLFYQRLRWQRGAIENLLAYGITRHTLPYVVRQVMKYLVVMFLPFYLTAVVFTLLTAGSIGFPLFWTAVTVFIEFERAWTARKGGWRSIALSALVIPEIAFDLFLHSVYLRAAIDTATHTRESWGRPRLSSASGSERRRRAVVGALTVLYMIVALGVVITLAVACSVLGVAWTVISVLVLAGTAHAAIRLSGRDPLGFALGSGETLLDVSRAK
jgi:cellulose synthase/poly-beta-1,6-N-acetylglucosamine synthase-like glycosyltransferase